MVIFDCNGVLVDGDTLATDALALQFTHMGFDIPYDVVHRTFTGYRSRDITSALEAVLNRALPASFSSSIETAIMERYKSHLRAISNVADTLKFCREPMCVVSSSSRARIHLGLELTGLDRFFRGAVFSTHDVERGKPHPDIFLKVAHVLNVNPKDCIVVENSVAGIRAATAAGMSSIGFIDSNPHASAAPSDLLAAGAQATIGNMRILNSAISAIRSRRLQDASGTGFGQALT